MPLRPISSLQSKSWQREKHAKQNEELRCHVVKIVEPAAWLPLSKVVFRVPGIEGHGNCTCVYRANASGWGSDVSCHKPEQQNMPPNAWLTNLKFGLMVVALDHRLVDWRTTG